MPCDKKLYPPNWKQLRVSILERAENRCEGSPRYPNCRALNYAPHPVTGSRVILTIAHLDQDVRNNSQDNLRALCQRCHLTHDARQHAQNAARTRQRKLDERMRQLSFTIG